MKSHKSHYSLAKSTWLRAGGAAELFFAPASLDELVSCLSVSMCDVHVLGAGSNVLIRDGGIHGLVISLKRLNGACVDGNYITAYGGCLGRRVAFLAARHSLSGVEYMCGVPGTIGGMLRMNSGAHNQDISQTFHSATAVDKRGKIYNLSKSDFSFSYRNCGVCELIFTRVTLECRKSCELEIRQKMRDLEKIRQDTQPIYSFTCGSTFKNPPGQQSAWKYIKQAGGHLIELNGARFSPKHANFLINETGEACARDLETVAEVVRQRVLAQTGVLLEWEVHRIGHHAV